MHMGIGALIAVGITKTIFHQAKRRNGNIVKSPLNWNVKLNLKFRRQKNEHLSTLETVLK